MVARALVAALGSALVAGGLPAAGCGGDEPGEAVLPSEAFGVNAQSLQRLPSVGRADEMRLHLDSIAELGFDFVRSNLDWRMIEPVEGRFDWRTTDAWVAALAERGLRWQPTVMGTPTPSWALDRSAVATGCGFRSPPSQPADYAALLAELARRYGRGGRFWAERPELPDEPIEGYELWNEPNHHFFWCPRPDPEAWAALALAGARAIHAVDSDAHVLSGGLAGFRESEGTPPHYLAPDEFLRRALAAEPALPDEIDRVAVHPYGPGPAQVARTLARFRAIVDATPLRGKPLSVNEFGWATSGTRPAVAPEPERAAFVALLTPAIAASSCGVEELALHTWASPELSPANTEHWFGVADPVTAEPYPTALAYATQAAKLSGGDAPAGGEELVPEGSAFEPRDPCGQG